MSLSMTGVVQSVRKDGKGFKINEVWYSGYTPDELNGARKGDTVTFSYTEKGQYKNLVKDSVVVTASGGGGGGSGSGGGGGYSGGGDKQFRSVAELNRIDALRLAVETVKDGDDKARVKSILKLAPIYVAFIEGQLGGVPAPATNGAVDAEAAAKAAAEAAAAKAKAEAEAAAQAAAAQQAQVAAAGTALDDFING